MCENDIETVTSPGRRTFVKSAGAISLLGMIGHGLMGNIAHAAALTKAKRDAMTPDDIIEMMKKGNERFRKGKSHAHNYLTEQRLVSAAGQYPAAIALSCIDSRAPAETLMDLGIGDIFNARVAGNILNQDLLGSMEFACKLVGAKVIVVMGHTKCGAVKGAIENVELGNLTGLLTKIRPAIDATRFSGDRSGKNYAFVDAVARKNVELIIEAIRKTSSILGEMSDSGKIKIVGSMYDIESGKLEFF